MIEEDVDQIGGDLRWGKYISLGQVLETPIY